MFTGITSNITKSKKLWVTLTGGVYTLLILLKVSLVLIWLNRWGCLFDHIRPRVQRLAMYLRMCKRCIHLSSRHTVNSKTCYQL